MKALEKGTTKVGQYVILPDGETLSLPDDDLRPDVEGEVPDGACLDDDGRLWVPGDVERQAERLERIHARHAAEGLADYETAVAEAESKIRKADSVQVQAVKLVAVGKPK